MKKKKVISFLSLISLLISTSLIYYYYPRSIDYEMVRSIQKPYEDFDMSYFKGFNYVNDQERLKYWLNDFFNKSSSFYHGYNPIVIDCLSKELDFYKFDYIITWHREIEKLQYSPHLSKTKDDIPHDRRIPLIPTFKDTTTDSIYIYKIRKNNKFRAFGP